ncbi:MAG: tripartite tricarboxylate transporter substrate binding protein [Oscillospiraceae bacterium]|nr:tripartite tricarboxylate transporter substrate binding protein [Oscillospiraceae bacterium]
MNVVVQNVEGGGGTTGTSQAVNSAADGYTLAICSKGGYLINPVINEVGYTWETTTPIAIVSEIPIAIGVAGSSSYQTLDELLAAAGDSSLTYSTPGANSTPHLLAAAVAMQAGVSWNHSPNSSSPAAIAELIGGHIDAVCVNLPTFKSYTPNGDVRLLAVTGEERDSNYPDVPTFKELGYDFDASVYFCIVAPDGLNPEIITILPFHFGAIPGLTVTTALAMFTLLTYALSRYTAFGLSVAGAGFSDVFALSWLSRVYTGAASATGYTFYL